MFLKFLTLLSSIAFMLLVIVIVCEELNTINIEINAPCGSVLFIH